MPLTESVWKQASALDGACKRDGQQVKQQGHNVNNIRRCRATVGWRGA